MIEQQKISEFEKEITKKKEGGPPRWMRDKIEDPRKKSKKSNDTSSTKNKSDDSDKSD